LKRSSLASLFSTQDVREGTPHFLEKRSPSLTAHSSSVVLLIFTVTWQAVIYTELATTFQLEFYKTTATVTHQGRLNAEGFRFAIISSRWNDFLTSRLVEGALDALDAWVLLSKSRGFKVPGSFEIPLLARKVAGSGSLMR